MKNAWHEIEWDDELNMKLWNGMWPCEPFVRPSQEQQIFPNDIAFFKGPLKNSWTPKNDEKDMQPPYWCCWACHVGEGLS